MGWRSVTPEYFSALGIPLLRGRNFRGAGPGSRVPYASSSIKLWHSGFFPARIHWARSFSFPQTGRLLVPHFTVIGVAGNTQNEGLGGRAGPEYYMVRRHTRE